MQPFSRISQENTTTSTSNIEGTNNATASVSSTTTDNAVAANSTPLKSNIAISRIPDFENKEEDNTMADLTPNDFCTLHMDHGDIRRDVAGYVGDARREAASYSADIRRDIVGSVGDARREAASYSSDIRRDVAGYAGDIRREGAEHASDIRREGSEHASDIRREAAVYTSDIRREGAEHTNEIIKEGLKSECGLRGDIKDARYDLVNKVDQVGDRLTADIDSNSDAIKDRLFTVSRDTMDLRAQVTSLFTTVKDNAALSALQTEKAVLQNTIEGQKNTQYLSDKIAFENEKTRDLINDLKTTDLNRYLIERNAELVEERHHGRHWRHLADQNQFAGQWAQLQSQVQAFQSQLQETRQGLVNFGTMDRGAGQQTSTSNNVR